MAIKNSDLLNKLIEYGKKLGNGNHSPMTADRYVVAIIDTVIGTSGIDINLNDLGTLSSLLEKVFKDSGDGYKETRSAFEKHITEKQSEMDGWSFQQAMLTARKLVESNNINKEILNAYVLFEYLIISPSGLLKDYIKGNESHSDILPKNNSTEESARGNTDTSLQAEQLKDVLSKKYSDQSKAFLSGITSNIKSYYDKISEEVLGQEHAISEFISGLFRSELIARTDTDRHCPRATFLFAGPPGVGKTHLSETVAKLLKLPFKRFDMSEYCDKEASLEFIGSDAVYKNAKRGNFTAFVDDNPESIILLDEIEKAHISIIHLFLQILDAGQIRDSKTDKVISLKDTILIFTTNAGKQLYKNSESGNFSRVSKKVILKALEKDVNPQTQEPYFPPAICSRFATGNVVMFNTLPAETLRKIAQKQIQRNIKGFEEEFGINVSIDENVYSSLLFSEGGLVDGRTIRSRAESFFHEEIFELFRLMESKSQKHNIEKLENIHFTVELPVDNQTIQGYFSENGQDEILVYASKDNVSKCENQNNTGTIIHGVQNIEIAKSKLKGNIRFVLIDLHFDMNRKQQYLNYEDEETPARELLRYILQYHSETPVYILLTEENSISDEEKVSYYNVGVNGIFSLTENGNSFQDQLSRTSKELQQRDSVIRLAKANKLIKFETAQSITDDGKTAEIKLFDYQLTVAVEAEDSENIMSNISKPDVCFDRIIGAEDAKSELKYFVEYLKNPKKYIGTGVGVPKGVLLYGPPGTGKTMLAKAVAAESDVTFISIEGNQFMRSYVGESSQMVHDIFRTARKYAPSIIFIDEIDTIARARTGDSNTVASEAALTAMLAEMDGFKKDNSKPVFVLAATNYDVDSNGGKSLDPAVLRRFDRRIYVDLPNREERNSYLKMRFSENTAFEVSEEKIHNIAIRSTGMSLAELASVIELALRTAIKDGNLRVTDKVLDEAFEEFNSGEKKKWDADLLKRVARHEAGHAFLCWESGETPSYLTIVARSNHGGYMQHDDNEGKALYTRDELIAKIRTALGGRAAEMLYYGDNDGFSTGASGDLITATDLARRMICDYGMSERFGLAAISSQAAVYGNLSVEIFEEINQILSNELKNAIDILNNNKTAIDSLVEELLIKNHLNGDEISRLLTRTIEK